MYLRNIPFNFARRTVKDPQTGQNVVLSREDCAVIQQIKSGKYADSSVDPYSDWPDAFEREVEVHPLSNRPEDKRSFIPSKWERLKVSGSASLMLQFYKIIFIIMSF